MSINNHSLVKQAIRELEALPETMVREVLDFIGELRVKHGLLPDETPKTGIHRGLLLSTFGNWNDERDAEEIVQEIYESRTISESDYNL